MPAWVWAVVAFVVLDVLIVAAVAVGASRADEMIERWRRR